MTRLAAIDIGTNSTKMTVADVGDAGELTVVSEDTDVTRLGEGVDRAKRLNETAVARTLEVVQRFADAARKQGAVEVLGAGTSALRDAANGRDFIDQVRQRAGVEIEIITGDREAQLAYAAVRADTSLSLSSGSALMVFDIGGGSTELILGDVNGVERHTSLDIGAVRLTERFLRTDPPSAAETAQAEGLADESLASFAAPETPPTIAGIGGTAVNIASVTKGLAKLDVNAVHGVILSNADVRVARERFESVPLAERRLIPGLEPKRADIIAAGALILDRLLAHFGARQFLVSARGLRFGLLADHVRRHS